MGVLFRYRKKSKTPGITKIYPLNERIKTSVSGIVFLLSCIAALFSLVLTSLSNRFVALHFVQRYGAIIFYIITHLGEEYSVLQYTLVFLLQNQLCFYIRT